MELIKYLKANYSDVRVIGIKNPSVIVTYKATTYIFYNAKSQNKGKHVICNGLERFYFDRMSEIKRYIK